MTSLEGSAGHVDAALQDQKFVVITVHGTFAGIVDDRYVFWWQDGSQLCADIRQQKPGAMLGFEAFPWRDAEQRPGPNRESERRQWGQQLLKRLRKLEDSGTPYHLIGHSHGGSVIWHALRLSAGQGLRLDHLRSWCTVGTPFLEFGPDRSAWWRIVAAAAALWALVWWGVPGSVWSLVRIALSQGMAKAADAVPLLKEFADIEAALGDATFYAVLALIAVATLIYLAILFLPTRDFFRVFAARADRRRSSAAAGWYAKSWLGIVHQHDEAVAGLKATLIRPPRLVLRQRRGWRKYVLRIFDPLARVLDQIAWSVLIKNAQGADLPSKALRSAGTAPAGFEHGPIVLPDDVANEIVAKADTAAAGVLARVRERLETAADKEDLEALTGVLSGTYDRDSLIHTTMFESAWVRSTILANMFSPQDTAVQNPSIRQGAPWLALPLAKVAAAVGFVTVLGTLMLFAYQAVIYPQTNTAQAERILARFDDPSFQVIGDWIVPGNALVRAYRLGAPFEKVFSAAAKLDDVQSEANAYQVIIREMALTGNLDEVASWIEPARSLGTIIPSQRYRHPDHLPLAVVVALEALAQSGVPPTATMTKLYAYASAQALRAPGGAGPQNVLFARLIRVAVSLRSETNLSEWLDRIGSGDPDCSNWTSVVRGAAPLVRDVPQLQILETVIQACKPAGAGAAVDKQRMLRRIAVGAIPDCKTSKTMLAQASFNRAGSGVAIPPRFIECLVAANRRDDAAKLVADALNVPSTSPISSEEVKGRLALAETLRRLAFQDESKRWAEFALAGANEIEKRIGEYEIWPELDAWKLAALKILDRDRLQSFAEELRKGGEEFANSQQVPAARKKLRSLSLRQIERSESNSCDAGVFSSSDAVAILRILKSYPDVTSLAMSVVEIAEVCKQTLSREILNELLTIASANNDSSKRAEDISRLAPNARTLRAGLQLADSAGIPVSILKGYAGSVDRLRPALRPTFDGDFAPLRYVKPNAGGPGPGLAAPSKVGSGRDAKSK